MTCKECIHYSMCSAKGEDKYNENCNYFQSKSKFIETPCNVGDTVYYLNPKFDKTINGHINYSIVSCKVLKVSLSVSSETTNCIIGISPDERIQSATIGWSAFLTYEEAAKQREELQK